ncbi:PREDICTED: uncharacterized protein LOC109208009 [Nicotiana attenuata]|uniref:uncharacterized protein LOC109208009 n=1 Tax=Nicotiana attenuata TaxID=49451 RepID=UPI000905CF78|nr:PREDICTED: uncharacterized protein LOC109208009 [Nicotiana attenuata]
MVRSEVDPQNNAINRDASQSHAILVPGQVGDNVNPDTATAEKVLNDAQRKAAVVQSVAPQSCSGPPIELQINMVNSGDSPAQVGVSAEEEVYTANVNFETAMTKKVLQEVLEQTAIVQSEASQMTPDPSARPIPQAMVRSEVKLHSNAIKSDASQSSGHVAERVDTVNISCGADPTKEVLSEDQQIMEVQSAASQTPSVLSVGKLLEDILCNEVQPQSDAIQTDPSQSHVTLSSAGVDNLKEKENAMTREVPLVTPLSETKEEGYSRSKYDSHPNLPVSSCDELAVSTSGSMAQVSDCLVEESEGDSKGEGAEKSETNSKGEDGKIEAMNDKCESDGKNENDEKEAGRRMKAGESQASSLCYVEPTLVQIHVSDCTNAALLDKGDSCKNSLAGKSGANMAAEKDVDQLQSEDLSHDKSFVSKTEVASIESRAGGGLAKEQETGDTIEEETVVSPAVGADSQNMKGITSFASPSTKTEYEEITKDLSRVEEEKSSTLETFEKQSNVADSLAEKCESDLAAQDPDMEDSDVSEVAPSPRNESRSSLTGGTSQREPEQQAIAEANLHPETFRNTESGAREESLSLRIASNPEAVEAPKETFCSNHDTNCVAELQAVGSSENRPELKQVMVEDMRTKICEESASHEVDDIVPPQTEKAGVQCRDDLSVETNEGRRSEDNVDVLNGELKKPLSSTIAGTSEKVADLQLVAEENTVRINDGSIDSGQVAEKSEDISIQDLTIEGQETKGSDAAEDTSTSNSTFGEPQHSAGTSKNEVVFQFSALENIEKMYSESVASGEVTAPKPLIKKSQSLHVQDLVDKGFDATGDVSKSKSGLNEAQPGGTSQIGVKLQLVAGENSETRNKEDGLPDATAVKPPPCNSENLGIQDPAHQEPENQRSDTTEEFSTLNVELNESQPEAADGTSEIVVESNSVSKQDMEIPEEIATVDVTAENAAVGKSKILPLIDVAVEGKGNKESDVIDEISNSELSEPKSSQSTVNVETHLICDESGMTDKEVAPLEVEVVETPCRDFPGCSGRDLEVEGQEEKKSTASKNVSNPESKEPKGSPGARAADNGAESQLVAQRNSETALSKEVFSGKDENSSIKQGGDEDVSTATEYDDEEFSSATGAGDDKTVSTAVTDA